MEILTKEYFEELEKKILKENYSDFFGDILEDFKKEKDKFKTEIIDTGQIFYRARVGNGVIEAAIDDLDIKCKIPYFGSDMEKPPAKFVQGGRFNRQGVSYLYLADNIETCIAEIHLQVGQICSIVEFECVKKGNYVLIESNSEEILYDILTRPVHSDIKDYYLVTQFFSDIFKMLGYDGIVFFSTQGSGKNVVSFKKDCFKLVKYSERMCKAKRISYEYELLEAEYKKYKDCKKLLMPGNISEEQKRESICEYIQEKINYEDELLQKVAEKEFQSDKDEKKFLDRISAIDNKQNAYEFLGAFYFNQQDLKKGMAYFLKAPFEHCSPRFEGILKRIQSCTQIENKELYQEESMKKELRIIFDELSQEHEKIRKKMEVDILKNLEELCN